MDGVSEGLADWQKQAGGPAWGAGGEPRDVSEDRAGWEGWSRSQVSFSQNSVILRPLLRICAPDKAVSLIAFFKSTLVL